jgi:hypothetical protein
MRLSWIFSGIAVAALLSPLAACKSSGAGGSGGGAGGEASTGGGGASGGEKGSGGAGGEVTTADCTCACTTLMSAGGCADLCDDKQNGQAGTPNWCNGAAALSQCAACLGSKCSIDPTDQEAQSSCM